MKLRSNHFLSLRRFGYLFGSFPVVSFGVVLSIILLIICLSIVEEKDRDETGTEMEIFYFTVLVSFILAIPLLLDIFSEIYWQKYYQFDTDRCRITVLILVSNLIILSRGIALNGVPFVLFFQRINILCFLCSRVYKLSESETVSRTKFNYIISCYHISFFINQIYGLSENNELDNENYFYVIAIICYYATICYFVYFAYNLFLGYRKRKKIMYLKAKNAFYAYFFIFTLSSIDSIVQQAINSSKEKMFDPSFYHLLYRQCFSIFIIMSLLIMSSWTNKLSVISAENELNMHKTMTRSISHEIRTPLNTAFMGLELLRDDLKYPSRNQAEDNRTHGWIDTVETIREACNISLGILNQLLTFDKLSSGMLKLERKMTPVIDVVNINTKLFRIQAIQAGVTFNVDMSGDDLSLYKNLLLHIDEYKMNQVLRNLLSNAMKFTPRKGTVTVKLKYNAIEQLSFASTASRAEQEGYTQKGIIKLSIVDTGPGVRKEDQKKLFQEYVQINPGELQKGQGSGLGLSISKSIVDLHGGTIGMHSDGPGRGSTFFVELPVYHPKPAGRFGDSFRDPNLMTDFSAGLSFRHNAIKRALSMNIVSPLNSPSWRGSRARVNPTVDMKFSPRSDEDLESGTKVSSLVRAITPPPAYLLPRLKHAATAPLVSPRTALYSYTEMHPPRFEEKPTEDGVIQVSSPLAYDRLVQTDPKLWIETPSGCNEKSEAMVHPDPDHPSMKQIQRTNSFGDKFQPISRQSSNKSINNIRDTSSHMLFPISIPSSRFRASTSSRWLADENSKLHLLVVDDSAANRKMLGLLLTREGHTFVDCDDGSTAVELIKKQMERSLQRAVASPPLRRASTGIIRTNSSLASRKVGQLASSFSKVLSRPSYDVEDLAAVRQIEVTNIEQDNSENNSPVPLDSKKRKESSRHTSIYNSSQSSSNVYGGLEPENIEQAVRDAVVNANNSSSNMLVSTNSQSRLRTSFGGEDVEGLDQEEPIIEIILIDNLMTHMDGPEAARNIRMLGFEGPIVGVTGMMDGDEDGFIANGANLILLKPLTRRSLHAALKSIRATYAGL